MQLPTSKRRKLIKRLVKKLMSSMCLNWEHRKSGLSLESRARSAYHRHCLWFYPIIWKPLKNVESEQADVCWIQRLLTASSPCSPESWVIYAGTLVTVTRQNCFDKTKKGNIKARKLYHFLIDVKCKGVLRWQPLQTRRVLPESTIGSSTGGRKRT